MKKFTFSLCLFLACTLGAFAQDTPTNEAVDKTTASISRLMAQNIGLNENEYIQVRTLNHERLSRAAEASKNLKGDPENLAAHLRDIDEDFEIKLFKILSNRQVEAYAEFKLKPEANFLSLVQEVNAKPKK